MYNVMCICYEYICLKQWLNKMKNISSGVFAWSLKAVVDVYGI